jgi:hypothetical protein
MAFASYGQSMIPKSLPDAIGVNTGVRTRSCSGKCAVDH